MSKLVDAYNKSTFANIGKKVSAIQGKLIPGDIKISTFKTKTILELQKDFFEEVVLPYSTILDQQSNFGKIVVNPTTSVVDLFSKITTDVSPVVVISTDSDLVKLDSIYNDIRNMSETFLINSKLPTLQSADVSSLLKFDIKDINLFNTPSLENSSIQDYNTFTTPELISFNSIFDDIVDFKTTSVLEFNSIFDDIVTLPYSNILELNSQFDDLIIKNIESVLKIYLASNLPSTIPGVVDFFADYDKIANIQNPILMEQTPDKNIATIVEMPITPVKPIGEIVEMPNTPTKEIVDIIPIPDTPEKNTIDPVPMSDPDDKPISDINPPADTLEKPIATVIEPAPTPAKEGVDVFDGMITPEKIATNIIEMPNTPEKPIVQLGEMEDIEKVAGPLGVVNFIPDTHATGFTKFSDILTGRTEYNLDNTPDLYEFNFNDNSYGGVLNQYAVYFSKYPPLTNVTYKTIVDWAYNRTILVPNALALYEQGFHTPRVPVDEAQLIIPPYKQANDRLPTWANTYLMTLENAGSTLVAGYLSQRTIDLLDTLTDVGLADWKKSPVVFHQLAGEIYWSVQDLGSSVRSARESLINLGAGIFGRTLTEYFVPKIEQAIGGAIANAVNNTLNASLLTDDKVLMMYYILMGTKYTKSKAFFDRLTSTYNSKFNYVGDNAVNLYNFEYKYSEGGKTLNTLNAVNYAIPYVNELEKTITSFVTPAIGIEIPKISSQEFGQMLSTYAVAINGISETLIPIGMLADGNKLINSYLIKKDSKTFGSYTEERPYYSNLDTPIDARIYTYDGPILTGSMDINHPQEEDVDANAFRKYDLETAANEFPANLYGNTFSTDFAFARNRTVNGLYFRENRYSELLAQRLIGTKQILTQDDDGKGLDYGDKKNRLNMIRLKSSQEDTDLGIEKYDDSDDLINFYFEDLSSLSDGLKNESIVIPFRAIITTITDGTNANWSAQEYMGRADKFWIYQGFERRVAINFEVAINSKDEFLSSWNKINYLQGLCYPVAYPAQISMKAPIMALTVGNLFDRIQVIMNSINYSFDGGTLWEIEKNFQLPMHIKIAVDFTVIFADVPKTSAKHIVQSQKWIEPKVFDISGNEQNLEEMVALTGKETGENVVDDNKVANQNAGANYQEYLKQQELRNRVGTLNVTGIEP